MNSNAKGKRTKLSPAKNIVETLVKSPIVNPIGALTGIDPIGDLLFPEEIKPPKPAPPPPPLPSPGAAPFVAPERRTQAGPVIGGQSDADLKSKAKGRSSLVIDLNLGSSRGGTGLQIPR